MNYFQEISSTPLLSSFSTKEIEAFLENGEIKLVSYNKNRIIHFDGELCDRLEIIIGGQVAIDRIDSEGNLLRISHFTDGDIMGGNIMFSSNPIYLMTVTALTDTLLLEISKTVLFDLLSSNKLFLKTYLEFVSDLTTVLGNKIRNTINIPLKEKIINYLRQEYKTQASMTIQLRVSKKALAERFGVERTSLSRELKKMSTAGLIAVDKKTITIVDKELVK